MHQTPAAQAQVMVSASPPGMFVQEQSPAMSTPNQSTPAGANNLLGCNETTPYSGTFDLFNAPNILGSQNDFDDLSWMTGCLDPCLWPISFGLGREFDILQNTGGADRNSRHVTANAAASVNLGFAPIPASEIADLYSRVHSPALDQDAVEVRQYHPTLIELGTPLYFPDINPASIMNAELEDFAHVQALSSEKVDAITQLAEEMQREPHHPPLTNLKIPPRPILNA